MRRAFVMFFAIAVGLHAGAQVQGPIYELMDEYRQALADGQADPSEWAQRISNALTQYPDEEWTTRIRAYEELGSLYWRVDQYDDAAPIFLELWQEAQARGDSDAAITSLDHLINLYGEGKFPAEEVLALYDATEGWLREPPPGREELYAKLLLELYSERSARAANYAGEALEGSAEQRAYADQAAYFSGLAEQGIGVSHTPTVTLTQIAEQWFAKNKARHAAEDAAEAAATEGQVELSTTPVPPKPAEPASPQPTSPTKAVSASPPAAVKPVPVVDQGIPTELVVLGCLAVILVGWGLAAYLYLRRRP